MQFLINLLRERGFNFPEGEVTSLLFFDKITLTDDTKVYVLRFGNGKQLRTDSELVFKQLAKVTLEDLPLDVCFGEVIFNGKKQITLVFPFF